MGSRFVCAFNLLYWFNLVGNIAVVEFKLIMFKLIWKLKQFKHFASEEAQSSTYVHTEGLYVILFPSQLIEEQNFAVTFRWESLVTGLTSLHGNLGRFLRISWEFWDQLIIGGMRRVSYWSGQKISEKLKQSKMFASKWKQREREPYESLFPPRHVDESKASRQV